MNTLLNEMLGRQRYQEMLREAEQDHTRRELQAGRTTAESVAGARLGTLLIGLGHRLEQMGERLAAPGAGQRAAGGLR